jgi:hypothetical protein
MRWFTVLALAVALGLATAASPFASSSPDGLTRVAADHGFDGGAKARRGPIAGYAAPGIGDQRVAKGLAGFAGTLLVFTVGTGIARAVRR